jgi:hypothetical protein
MARTLLGILLGLVLACHAADTARVQMSDAGLRTTGCALAVPVQPVAGPLDGVLGFRAGADTRAVVSLQEPQAGPLTISFWARPLASWRNGPGVKKAMAEVLRVGDLGSLQLRRNSSDCLLGWNWAKGKAPEGVTDINNPCPGLEQGEWFHMALSWLPGKGEFAVYYNAVPVILPGTRQQVWQGVPVASLTLDPANFEYADVRVEDAYLTWDQIQQRLPEGKRFAHGDILGFFPDERKPLDIAERKGALLYSSNLDSQEAVAGWRMEGPGITEFQDGWMRMRAEDEKQHIVYWCPLDFPASFVAEWEAQPLKCPGLCIVFFSAKGTEGEDIFDPSLPPRDGTFKQYIKDRLYSYHISYYANTPFRPGRVTANLRKNNWFYLTATGPAGIPAGADQPSKVRLLRDGAHIQLTVDGRVVIDWTDDGTTYGPVHKGGKIGFRQMQWTDFRYCNLRVWEMRDAE